jgi:phage terminase large subunit-like protein
MRPGLSRVGRVVAFLESLPVTKGILAGRTMRLLPDQRAFIEKVYGDGQTISIGVKSEPRGNGKTGLVAGLALCHLLGPEAEARGEVDSASIDRPMASIIFNEMAAMILEVPSFTARVNIQRFHKRIEVLWGAGSGSVYEALSADARRGHGLAPSLWIYDELAQARDGELLSNLRTAMGKRARSLGLVISTQAPDDDHPLSRLIDDGLSGVDPTIVVDLTAAPPEADPYAEETIRAVNPALGIFLDEKIVFAEAAQAKRVPLWGATFRNRRLNQRVAAEGRWLALDAWDSCGDPVRKDHDFAGRRAFLGLDLSTTTDLTCLIAVLPDDVGDYDVRAEFFAPAANIVERSRRDRVPYELWRDEGFLTATPGNIVDEDVVETRIHAWMEELDVQEVAVDPWNAKRLVAKLQADTVPAFEVPQTMANLTSASKELEKLVLSRRIRHDGHPVLRWCVSNTVAEIDGNGNIKPSKKRSRERIDGVSALVTALARAIVNGDGRSIYDERPVRFA